MKRGSRNRRGCNHYYGGRGLRAVADADRSRDSQRGAEDDIGEYRLPWSSFLQGSIRKEVEASTRSSWPAQRHRKRAFATGNPGSTYSSVRTVKSVTLQYWRNSIPRSNL